MERHFGFSSYTIPERAPVLTMGMFDGVHRGHQRVIATAREEAARQGAPTIVLTFDTHPRSVVRPEATPPMITSLEHRLSLFEREGVDAAVVISFTERLARMTGEVFVSELMVGVLGAGTVVLGEDAHFGCERSGNMELLHRLGPELGFRALSVPPTRLDSGEVISSSAIRAAVREGDIDAASDMLGRDLTVLGTVVSGLGIGRQLGFPTLNLDLHHELHPPRGVYVTTTRIGATIWPSVVNIGHRPTIDAQGGNDVLVESHILDENVGDLNGQVAEIAFIKHLRDEKKFANREALQEAIARDVAAAREWFVN